MTSVQRNLNGITKQGKFKTIVWIPVKIFSNGYFNVAILFFASNIYNTERILQTNQILRFKIFDKILSEIKGQVDLNIPSALIPEFNWETDIY